MKVTDDYKAKIRLWATDPKVEPLPAVGSALPRFLPQKFSSHEEMNRWKKDLLAKVARFHAAN